MLELVHTDSGEDYAWPFTTSSSVASPWWLESATMGKLTPPKRQLARAADRGSWSPGGPALGHLLA